MGTTARLRFLLDHRPTAIFCTPTYALHLIEVAAAEKVDLTAASVRSVIVAGEPGAGVSGTRDRIEAAFAARVFDQYGLTEVGPAAAEMRDRPGELVVHEDQYLAEVLSPGGTDPAAPGEVGELVLTTLARTACPLIRYRTGDLVRVAAGDHPHGLRLAGGVLGRTDDMIHVRGNNLYPTAIEAVIRRFPEVAEFRIVVDQSGPLADLRIEVEPADASAGSRLADAVAKAVRDELLFRADVLAVPPGTLPRFEMKARRVVRHGRPHGTSDK
jgi:phenylacetate-CoA ligase